MMRSAKDPSTLQASQMEVMWRIILSVSLLCLGSEGNISCKNENNGDVDWYILYKAPEIKAKLNGVDYVYIDPNIKGFQKNSKRINDKDGVLANTLKPIFSNTPSCGFISYSDQPPEHYTRANQEMGHSKGVVMVDATNVVWLLHSTPNFPYHRNDDFYPAEGRKFGQTFICVTLPRTEFDKIVKHLQFIRAYAFDHHMPQGLQQVVPKDKKFKSTQDVNQLKIFSGDLRSAGQVEFKHFYKKISPYAVEADLYVTIAEELKSDVYVQTWGRQFCRDFTYCPNSGFKVYNVEDLDIQTLGLWNRVKDHSKWCVSTNNNNHWTCIADSNRAVSQYERPGGALCIKSQVVAEQFRSFVVINEVEGCPPTDASAPPTKKPKTGKK